jgi:hypothetical protein
LNRNVITVLGDTLTLRNFTDNRAERESIVLKGDELKVNHTIDAKLVGKSCLYPLTIDNSTYWIPENEIEKNSHCSSYL